VAKLNHLISNRGSVPSDGKRQLRQWQRVTMARWDDGKSGLGIYFVYIELYKLLGSFIVWLYMYLIYLFSKFCTSLAFRQYIIT
jgi:hypothetical protein